MYNNVVTSIYLFSKTILLLQKFAIGTVTKINTRPMYYYNIFIVSIYFFLSLYYIFIIYYLYIIYYVYYYYSATIAAKSNRDQVLL